MIFEFFGVVFNWHPGIFFATISAIVLGVFAVVVGSLAKFNGPAGAYAWFGASFALWALAGHPTEAIIFATPEPSLPTGRNAALFVTIGTTITGMLAIVWAISIARLVRFYGVTRIYRQPLAIAAVALLIVLRAVELVEALTTGETTGLAKYMLAGIAWQTMLDTLPIGLMLATPALLALAAVKNRIGGQAVLAVAIGAYPLMWLAWNAARGLSTGVPEPRTFVVAASAALLFTAIAWWYAREKTGEKIYGRVAWFAAVAFCFGSFMGLYFPGFATSTFARFLDVILVAFAIMRYQYLDLDVKVRWGISKSTIAAIFVAVFFVVSEGAAALFSERLGTGMGIAAAGALVFGIAPLMRMADRFATAAVPVVPATTQAKEIFSMAVQAALADGSISPKEELHLATIAEKLGLRPSETTAIRHGLLD